MMRTECPFDEVEAEEVVEKKESVEQKYVLRPPRDLRSKFLMAMEQKDAEKAAAEKQKQEEIRLNKLLEKEKPPPDEFYCRRLHGWVYLVPDDEDEQPFFIESSTGVAHPLNSPHYCSIQSIWNNTNYWVNLQDDSVGIGNMSFDFNDITKWEHLLPGEPIHDRIHNRELEMEMDEEAVEMNHLLDEQHLDMPEPWSLRIQISHQDVNNRFPQGNKKTVYKRTIVEQFSPYSQEDGLVMKIFKFADMECTDLLSVEERYNNRNDKWSKRTEIIATGLVMEFFDRGRDDNVKQHTFYKDQNDIESWRQIEYYHQSRFDCLKFINHDWDYLQEDYVNREDFLTYRKSEYARRGEPPPGFIEGPRRIIKQIVEKFDRDKEIRAPENIAYRECDFVGRKISLQFHYDDGKITASTRVFLKPPLSEMVDGISYRPELTYGYQSEIGAKPPKNSTLYALLDRQLKEEEECMIKVRHVEDIITEFVRLRAVEVLQPKLDVGLFNREQNQEKRRQMLEKESEDRTKKEREIEDELDYIRPYLMRDNFTHDLTYQQAVRVRNLCLNEFRDMILKRANRLQQDFQANLTILKKRREWYNEEVENLTYEEEQDYFRELNQLNFILHCNELRLNRLKETVPQKIDGILRFLDLHPQLQKIKKRKMVKENQPTPILKPGK